MDKTELENKIGKIIRTIGYPSMIPAIISLVQADER